MHIEGEIEWVKLANADMREASLVVDGQIVLSVAVAYGFRNIQNLVEASSSRNQSITSLK